MDPLKFARDQVAVAEQRLIAARESMRVAAIRANVPTKCLFADSKFVRRSSAKAWIAQAELKGREGQQPIEPSARETADRILAAVELARGGGPPMPEPTGVAARIIAADKMRRQG
jgi:hypothetical protein